MRHVQHSCRSSHLSLLIAAFLFAMLTFASPAKAEFPSDFPEERLDFTVEESAGGRVTFTITTSIPTPFEAIIGISLSGQQPRDVYIGHAERVFIDRERTEITLNLLNARMKLPAGAYRAQVAFYNAWGWRNGNMLAAETPDTVIEKSVLLLASGNAPAETRTRAEKQRWVFLNVAPDTRWVPPFFSRNIGPFELIEDGPLLSYLFPEANVIFTVSAETGKIIGWRVGALSRKSERDS